MRRSLAGHPSGNPSGGPPSLMDVASSRPTFWFDVCGVGTGSMASVGLQLPAEARGADTSAP